MKITLKKIKKLSPCTDRLENYIEHYGDKEFSVKGFLRLKHITHNDKVWVAFRMMPKKNIRFCVGEIARSVLHIFEEKYPDDDRPRKAIEAATTKNLNKTVAARASAAARAARAAARAAAYTADAAAYTADAASAAAYTADAASAAAYAAASAAASAAAYAAYAARAAAHLDQESVNLKIIRKYWK